MSADWARDCRCGHAVGPHMVWSTFDMAAGSIPHSYQYRCKADGCPCDA
mgnify:CR=1 FL=1